MSRHKQAEMALRKAQQYLYAILLHLPVGVAILEGDDLVYWTINKRLAEINGLAVEDHLGKPLSEVLPDAAPDIVPRLRRVLETGAVATGHEFSTRLPKNPDELRHFRDTFFPIIGPDGKPEAVGAIVEEITELRKAERLLVEGLTPRQSQVFELVAAGKKNREIADQLSIAQNTVEEHRAKMMKRLGVSSVAGVVRLFGRVGD